MYKNFKITEKEKKQILEMHLSHGYKKPLNEQQFDDQQQSDNERYEFSPNRIYILTNNVVFYLNDNEEEHDQIRIEAEIDTEFGDLISYEIDENDSDMSDDEIINKLKEKISNGYLNKFPSNGLSFDPQTGKLM
jgi:hypothetical protein